MSNSTKKATSTKRRKGTLKKKTFNTYIHKILREVHPDTRIGEKEGVPIVNSILDYVTKRIATATSLLLRRTGKTTVTSREIRSSVNLVFPGELAKHANKKATDAVTKYNAAQAGGPVGKKQKKEKTSKAAKAGLTLSVSRTSKIFYPYVQGLNIRKGVSAAIFLAGALEYLAAEILQLAGNAARDSKKVSIKPRHLVLAINNDEELNVLFRKTVLQGGVIPNIHQVLLPVKLSSKSKKSVQEF